MLKSNSTNVNCPTIRVVVLGDHNVGKTALIVRFLTRRFIGEYVSGKEITYTQDVTFSGCKVTAEIYDCLVTRDKENTPKSDITSIDAYMLVYSVSNRESFLYARQLAHEIKSRNVSILLVGNKSDLNHFREVKLSEGEIFSKSIPSCEFIETSAAESYSQVEKAFSIVFQLARRHNGSFPVFCVGGNRPGRKNSITQLTQRFRNHLSQHAKASSNEKITSLIRNASMNESSSPLSPDLSHKRKMKKKYIGHAHTHDDLSSGSAKPKQLSSKWLSLGTLTEHPTTERLNSSKNKFKSRKSNQTSNGMSTSIYASDGCKNDFNLVVGKLSSSSEDNFESSDISANEEEAFSSGSSSSTVSPEDTSRKGRTSTDDKNSKANRYVSKGSSLNRKKLHLSLSEDSEDGHSSMPIGCRSPQSAPLVHSATNNRFRYYPNGSNEYHDYRSHSLTPTNIPISPLLDRRQVSKIKNHKDEKKLNPRSFFKQIFKSPLNPSGRSSSFGSNQSLNSQPFTELSSNFNGVVGSSKSLTVSSLLQNRLSNGESLYFHTSSDSLSSVINSNLDPFAAIASAPSTPQMRKEARQKVRRLSIRETVGGLIRKRKQSISVDCLKQTNGNKERVS